MTTNQTDINLPPKLIPVFQGSYRYRAAYGGRGSGKTYSFALMSAVRAYMFAEAGISGVILCAREHLVSLEQSSMEEVKVAIRSIPWLNDYFEMGEKFIRTKNRRVRYVFSGLNQNIDGLKSKSQVLIAWIDEAEGTSEVAWRKLIPTVRPKGSEIWVTWNPESPDSATNQRMLVDPPTNSIIEKLNYGDNPWFSNTELEQERLDDQRKRPDIYGHIWEGEFLTMTEAQIFSGKYEVKEFEPDFPWDGPYHGLDWGFSQDPTAANQMYVYRDCLYIRREANRAKLELDYTSQFIKDSIPDIEKHVIRADNARPESISYCRRHGLTMIEACKKWPGSVEDGIEFMKSFERIYIHPDCHHTAREFRLYSYKVDKKTDDILPIIVDANNHHIDAIRYALGPMIQKRNEPSIRML